MAYGIFFTNEFWPTVGGIGEHSHQMAKHLTELGENITLLHYVPQGYQGDEEFDRNCGYPVVRFSTKIGTGQWYKDPWARTAIATTLVKAGRRCGAEYLIFNGWRNSTLFVASLSAAQRILGIPAFLFIHSRRGLPEAGSRMRDLAFGAFLRSAKGVIPVSHSTVALLERFKLKLARVHVICNGVDLREVDSHKSMGDPHKLAFLDKVMPSGSSIILCVARLSRIKRIDRLVRVMPRIQAAVPGARLVIAGVGDEEDQLRMQIADSTARDSITLLGLASGDLKLEIYARCAVLALSSESQGLPLVLLEAAAFGKPVVATAVGGVSEAVVDGETGLLVEPGNDEALACAIIRLLNNPEEARHMGKNGRSRVESKFTWTRSAVQLRAIIHQTIGNRN